MKRIIDFDSRELYIGPEIKPRKKKERDAKGRYLKGCNGCTGKKKHFSEEGMKKLLENLKKANKATGRKWTNNGRKVVGIRKDGSFVVFPSANESERRLGLCHGVVSNRCSGKTVNRFIGDFYWYWESDNAWIDFINSLKDEV